MTRGLQLQQMLRGRSSGVGGSFSAPEMFIPHLGEAPEVT